MISVSQQIDTSTPYGKNFMYQMANMAELEWAVISERYKDTAAYKIREGKAYTGRLPIGFKIEKIDGVKKVVHDNEEQTRAIFDSFLLLLLHVLLVPAFFTHIPFSGIKTASTDPAFSVKHKITLSNIQFSCYNKRRNTFVFPRLNSTCTRQSYQGAIFLSSNSPRNSTSASSLSLRRLS